MALALARSFVGHDTSVRHRRLAEKKQKAENPQFRLPVPRASDRLVAMELVFLGTGTSQGVPMIAHECPGLDLQNPRNWRTRSSIHVVMDGVHIQVDAAQEFRMQCLQHDVRQIDYFILTHGHADHILGMDDLRRFCLHLGEERKNRGLPVFSTQEGLDRIRDIYPYAVGRKPTHFYYPFFVLQIMPERMELECGTIQSTTLSHGPMDVLGLVFQEKSSGKKIAYYTDCQEVGPAQRDLARGAEVVVLDALQPKRHPTHMSIDEAVETALDIKAPMTYFTHLTYHIDHETYVGKLPDGIEPAYDGLRIQI